MSFGRTYRRRILDKAVIAVTESLENRKLFAFQTSINFGPDNSEAAPGYYTDIGNSYRAQSNGLTYGWINTSTGQPASVTSTAFDRNSGNSPDQRYDTGVGTRPSGVDDSWQIDVPNGTYFVRLVAGDANVTSGSYKYNVEDTQNFLSGTASTSNRWVVASGYVDVDDGKLTVSNGSGAVNYKLSFIEITDAPAKAQNTVSAPTDVVAVPASTTAIDVRWTDNSDNEDGNVGFKIERKTGAGAWSQIGTAFGNARLYTDTTAAAGTTYSYRVRAINGTINSDYSNESQTITPTSNAQAPYSNDGSNWVVPGQTVQAEDFDRGGSAVAYFDQTTGNAGGFYRSGNVDMGALVDGSNGYFVGWTRSGEWQEYTINAPAGGTYYVDSRVSSGGVGGTFRIEMDGVDKTGSIQVPDTGSFTNYDVVRSGNFALTAGTHVMRLYAVADNPTGYWVGNLDWFKVQRFDPPTNLTTQVVNESTVNLFWQDNTSGEGGFTVQRSSDGGVNWSDLATLDPNVTSFTDYDLNESTTYAYRVSAFDATASTPPSATATATTLPASPSDFYTDVIGATQVNLYWTDHSASETGFTLEQSADGVTWTTLATCTPNTSTYSATGLTASTQYFFRISAFNATGVSVFAQTSAETTAPGGVLPDPASGVTATIVTPTRIDLAWNDNTTIESG